MKRGILILVFVYMTMLAHAQSYPSEWIKYTSDGYLHDIQVDKNYANKSIAEFNKELTNIAVTNLAKQIKLHVEDVAQIKKVAIDGKSSISYSAQTQFSTDVEMSLVVTRTNYNKLTNEGAAIAYIDKAAAQSFYYNKLTGLYNEINNSIAVAEKYSVNKLNKQAKKELEQVLPLFSNINEPLFWLNIFGYTNEQLQSWQQKFNEQEQQINQMLIDMKHGISIYLSCEADIFGKPYNSFQKELKGTMQSQEYNFTDSITDADWIIEVECTSSEYNSKAFGTTTTYFAHANANIKITKKMSNQVICEDMISVKGGHTISFAEAAKQAYKDLKKKLGAYIKENISN